MSLVYNTRDQYFRNDSYHNRSHVHDAQCCDDGRSLPLERIFQQLQPLVPELLPPAGKAPLGH